MAVCLHQFTYFDPSRIVRPDFTKVNTLFYEQFLKDLSSHEFNNLSEIVIGVLMVVRHKNYYKHV